MQCKHRHFIKVKAVGNYLLYYVVLELKVGSYMYMMALMPVRSILYG